MKIEINKKDIRKEIIYVIEQNNKVKIKTSNINKIRSWQKTMNYLRLTDYKIYRIEVQRVYDRYNNIYKSFN